jgi:hypothetical protein
MKLSCLLLISLVMAILSPSLCQENAFENRVRRAADEPRRLMMMKKCPGTSKPVKPTMKPTKKGKGKGKKASKTCAPTMAPTMAPSSAAPSTAAPS